MILVQLKSQVHNQGDTLLVIAITIDNNLFILTFLRNEDFQEQLWKKTFDYLKEYLSPEVFSKYGPKVESLALST